MLLDHKPLWLPRWDGLKSLWSALDEHVFVGIAFLAGEGLTASWSVSAPVVHRTQEAQRELGFPTRTALRTY